MQHTEGTFQGVGDQEVYWQYWQPATPPRALLLLVHGAGEHSGRYAILARFFTARGYLVAALDHPGHGKSAGTYGHIDSLDELLATLDQFRQQVDKDFPGVPRFLIGHSMGGLLAGLHLLSRQQDYVGCVLSGAAIKTDIEPGALQKLLIRCLSLFTPRKGVMQLDANGVSRDPAVVRNYLDDPLVNHGQMSARMVAQLFSGMHRLRAEAGKITLPLLILHGDADTMTSPEGSRFLFEHAGSTDKALEIFPGLYHEIFNEPERDALFGDVLEWCDNRLTADAADH